MVFGARQLINIIGAFRASLLPFVLCCRFIRLLNIVMQYNACIRWHNIHLQLDTRSRPFYRSRCFLMASFHFFIFASTQAHFEENAHRYSCENQKKKKKKQQHHHRLLFSAIIMCDKKMAAQNMLSTLLHWHISKVKNLLEERRYQISWTKDRQKEIKKTLPTTYVHYLVFFDTVCNQQSFQ